MAALRHNVEPISLTHRAGDVLLHLWTAFCGVLRFLGLRLLWLLTLPKLVVREWKLMRGRKAELQTRLHQAKSLPEWREIATLLDDEAGLTWWKLRVESDHFDHSLIAHTLDRLRHLRRSMNLTGLVWELRAGLHRNLAGIGNPELHEKTLVGTKKLIEEYTCEVCACLEMIRDTEFGEEFSLQSKIQFFRETAHAYGRTALLLSGGSTLGMYHIGVIKALMEVELLPRIISGSSAGAIIAAIFCSRCEADIPKLFEYGALKLEPFQKLEPGSLRRRLHRLLTRGVLMDVLKLQETLRLNIGDMTFREAYDVSGRVLNITVSSASRHGMPSLLNYLTAPNVLLWSAACASCAIPGIFAPVSLVAKNEKGDIVPYHSLDIHWTDGSVEADLPMARLSELFNVNHFVVSQVNPHVIPFLSTKTIHTPKTTSLLSGIKHWALSEVKIRLLQLFEYGLMPSKLNWIQGLLTQKYEGDCTIVPEVKWSDYLHIFANPSEDEIQMRLCEGERLTWPKLSYLETQLSVEKTLHECLHTLLREVSPKKRHIMRVNSSWSQLPSDTEFSDYQDGMLSSYGGESECYSLPVSRRTSPCRDFTRLRLQGSPEAGREVEGDCSDEEEWTISLPRPRPRSVGSGAFHRASNNRETQDDRSSVSSFRSVHSSHSMTLFDM